MDYKSAAIEGAIAGALASLVLGSGRASLSKAAYFGVYGAGVSVVATFALIKTGHALARLKSAGPGGFLTGEDLRSGYYVGRSPPPGGDYSFTRRPGYNGKDY